MSHEEYDWLEQPVILAFDNGMTVVTYVAFPNESMLALKNTYLISRTFDGSMVIVRYLPECKEESVFKISNTKILTMGQACPQVLDTYMNVVFGKTPNEITH